MSFKLSTLSRQTEVSEVLSALSEQGMKGFDISDDEMAKSHARYMIGGAKTVENERVFRFGTFSFQWFPASSNPRLALNSSFV
jgi:threonine dehydratase